MVSELAAVRDRGWYVQSSVPLEGTVLVAGSKNSTTKLMIAACRADGPGEWREGTSPSRSLRTVRDSLPSYGSRSSALG